MSFSPVYGGFDGYDPTATINRALDLGVTMLDTADVYGPHVSEQVVGEAIASRRDEVTLATKFGILGLGPVEPGGGRSTAVPSTCASRSRARCSASVSTTSTSTTCIARTRTSRSRRRSGRWPSWSRPGRCVTSGLSEAAADTVRRAVAVHPIAALQTEYSLFSRDIEGDILDTCRELGVGIVPYSPLGRGMLTGTINGRDDLADGRLPPAQPALRRRGLGRQPRLVDEVAAVASAHGATPGQVALAWVLAQGDDMIPIPGTKRIPYLEENAAVQITLSPDELDRLNGLSGRTTGAPPPTRRAGSTARTHSAVGGAAERELTCERASSRRR